MFEHFRFNLQAIFNLRFCAATLLCGSALALATPPAAADPLNLVQNGSFAAAPGFTPYPNGSAATSSNLPGWQFSGCISSCGGSNDLFSFILQSNYSTAGIYDALDGHYSYFYNGGPGVSPDGGNAYAADADYQVGQMSQTISGLTVGQTYQLSFYQASMQQTGYSGAFDADWQVGFGSDTRSSQTMVNPSQGSTGWTLQTMDFTATSVSQALMFMASSTNAYPPFLLLDGVSLTALTTVPEPASIAIVGVGVLGLLALRRRRQQRAAHIVDVTV